MNIKIKFIYNWLLPPPLINNNNQFELAKVINIYYGGIDNVLKELGVRFTDDRWEIYRNYKLHASYLNFHKLR